jgi:hypothetical protein
MKSRWIAGAIVAITRTAVFLGSGTANDDTATPTFGVEGGRLITQ